MFHYQRFDNFKFTNFTAAKKMYEITKTKTISLENFDHLWNRTSIYGR